MINLWRNVLLNNTNNKLYRIKHTLPDGTVHYGTQTYPFNGAVTMKEKLDRAFPKEKHEIVEA